MPPGELDEFCHLLALGQVACEPQQPRTPEHAALEEFFARSRAEDLRTGTAGTGGNAALQRAMKLVAGKAPVALRLAETMIERGVERSLADGLQQEIDHVTEIFSTEDAMTGLTFRSGRQLGQPTFAGR